VSVEVSGQGGSGRVVIYTLPSGSAAMLEVLCFTITGSASGNGHEVRLQAISPAGPTVFQLDDLNVGGDGQTNVYTYGVGLNASACTLPTGISVTDALPWTQLIDGTALVLTPIDQAGATIAGDRISNVFMRFTEPAALPATEPPPSNIPLTLLPGAAAA
jgi:hypothetical protein